MSVTAKRRVVRCSRRTPSRSSSCATRLLSRDFGVPSARPAAEKPRCSTTAATKRRSFRSCNAPLIAVIIVLPGERTIAFLRTYRLIVHDLLSPSVKTNIGICRGRSTMNLLHIDSSALGAHSVSRELSGAIVKAWKRAHPGAKATYRDVAAQPLPHWTPVADADDPAARLGGDVLDEFLAADVVVIGAP